MINCGLDSHGVFLVIPRNIIGLNINFLIPYGVKGITGHGIRWYHKATSGDINEILKEKNNYGPIILYIEHKDGDIMSFSYYKDGKLISIYEND